MDNFSEKIWIELDKIPRRALFLFLVIVEIMLSSSWLGFINTDLIAFTTLQIPVLCAALFLGKNYGAAMGFVFGLVSVIRASALNFENVDTIFAPMFSGNFFGSIVAGIFTRVVFGYIAGIFFEYVKYRRKNLLPIAVVSAISCYIHSIFVFGAIAFFFPKIFKEITATIFFAVTFEAIFSALVITFIAKNFWNPEWLKIFENLFIKKAAILKDRRRMLKLLSIAVGVSAFFISLVVLFLQNLQRLSVIFNIEFSEKIKEAIIVWGTFFTIGTIATGILFLAVCFYFYDSTQQMRKINEDISAELNVAKDIQQSMLPRDFDFDRKEFEIFATMNAAKEVGGDFYDFYLLDENHLVVTMADVSGKGVPAALFMVISKTILKNFSMTMTKVDDFSAVISCANQQLCQNNDELMFVTVFMGMLDLKTGEFIYVNAGHNPPLIYRAEEKKYHYIESEKNYMLGIDEFADFKQNILQLKHGDKIFMYTDGVTEAMNERDEEYLPEHLLEVLNAENHAESLEKLLENVHDSIKKHAGNAEQSDDITMMVVKFN